MEKKILKGSVGSFFLGGVFALVPIAIVLLLLFIQNTDFYLKQNRVYGKTNTPVSVANIYSITPKLGQSADGKSEVYIVGTDKGYVVFEVEKNNQVVAQMLKDSSILSDKPVPIVVESVRDIDGEVREFLIKMNIDKEFQAQIEKNEFISAYNITDRNQKILLAAGGFTLIPILLVGVALKRVNMNKKAYNALFAEYPELEDDLDLIVRHSDFYDEKLKMALYKHHVIVFSRGFDVIDIRGVEKMQYILQKIHYGVVAMNNYYFQLHKWNGKKERVAFKGIKEDMSERIEKLLMLMKEKNPSMEII
ncbi:hypothetical protein NHG23_00885 [Aerococcaceae bacterium NML190073]|nr:hypothetical protein [Aerococcaceae bacterium NML190073]